MKFYITNAVMNEEERETKKQEIEINNIEELFEWIKKQKHPVILNYYKINELFIYNSWIE